MRKGWLPIEKAPKNKPIVGFCVHDADPYFNEGTKSLTTYGAHCESLSHVPDGFHVLEWGGEYTEDVSGEGWGPVFTIPDWWFRAGSDFEEVANPTHFMLLCPPNEP